LKISKAVIASVGISAGLFFLGCGSTVVEPLGAPSISAVLPQTITAGSSAVTMKVVGTNFTTNAVILWNGGKLATTVVDSTTVSGAIQGGSLAVPGTAQVQVQNTQTGQASQSVPISIVSTGTNVALPLAISTTSLSAGVLGTPYSGFLAANGGTSPYTWSITSGSLPAGIGLVAGSGALTGTPTTSGTFNFTVAVSDGSTPIQSQSAALSITVAPATAAPSQLAIATSSLPSGTDGTAYSQSLTASGGTPGYKWSITSGSLPAGLTLGAGTGLIAGKPTASGTSSFTVSVSDSGNPVQTKSALLSIAVAPASAAPAQLTIITSSLPSGTAGTVYSQSLTANGGTPGYKWSITSGSLPAGLTLSSGGVISGKPTASGTSTFTVSVSDSGNPVQTKSASLSITVASTQLTISTSSLASGASGAAYSQTLVASGGTPNYTWSITSGSLPAGLTLGAGTGLISGKPTASGTSSFTVSVSDSGNPVQTKSASLSIAIAGPTFTITSSTLAAATVGTAYSQTLAANGGTLPYIWSITSGSLPAGLTLSSGGLISGTPTASGSYKITITVTDSSKPVQTQSMATDIIVAAQPSTVPGTTWFVRPDGGTRYSANVPAGQCNGTYDTPYPGTGVDQNCAFNDVRYMWSDNSGSAPAWVIAGGDTVVIRGCTALSSQMNSSNPDCRLGYDNNNNGNPPNFWCGYGNPNDGCFNPPIPAGTAAQPTRILGGCAYGTYSCTPINNNYPYGSTNETQLFGGFGLTWTFNLESTSYVTIEGIELTTHNGVCTIGMGSPAYPRGCSSGVPYDDYAQNGFLTNNTTSNIVLQDVYVHGFNASGFYGPIGGPISMTRVFSGFNAFAGWNFDDGSGTPDAAGSSVNAQYVTMIFNGCYEQYPITAIYPAQVCYDTNSAGFGDSWSGQNTPLASFTCNYCVDDYNTKDGFIGPHVETANITITNSVAIGNMGANWKWGGDDSVVNTTLFENNLTVNNCSRMSQPITGAPSTFNQYLTGFCRAGGNGMASVIPIGSTWNLINNTFISAQQIALYVACNGADTTCPSTINSINNVFLGYTDPSNPYGINVPTTYYLGAGIVLNTSHNDEFGMQDGTCPSTSNGMICSDPMLLNEPAQPWPGKESDLDVFDPFVTGNSFHPSNSSPLLGAGIQVPGLMSTDYYDVARPTPPDVGGVEHVPAP